MSLLAWTLESSGALPKWVEAIYVALFIVPVLILCKPWYPLLSQWGLMQGEWIRLPSPLGVILVFGIYTLAAVIVGLLLNRLTGRSDR